MEFKIENSVIASYKRFSYEPWYALAEFVDNSTQAYLDHKRELDQHFGASGERLTVRIEYDSTAGTLTITDNAIGMDETTLSRALKAGSPPPDPSGRSRYGLGLKTAACWFGNLWMIKTKRLGSTNGYEVTFDVEKIAKITGDVDVPVHEFTDFKEGHYTIITIKKLNMKLASRTIGRIREFLSSMYRMDIAKGLHLNWNGAQLSWPSIEEKLYTGKDGKRLKWDLDFEVNGKKVKGWVGVLGKGAASRRAGGFSIFQNSRVIEGTYKPSSVFGEQEEGSNDLVNQRVTGELFLENFSVSHTKDKIVWEDDEQDLLDQELGKLCAEAKHAALTLRFRKDTQRDEMAKLKEAAVTTLTTELQSSEMTDFLNTVQPYPEKIIDSSFSRISEKAVSGNTPTIEATIGADGEAIHVQVYFNEASEFEPYVLTETTVEKNKMLIIINVLHPYVQEMTDAGAFTSFVRQGIYDGVAEWKALKLRGSIQPNTIKILKDGLLRIPYQIKSHQNV